MGHKYPTPKVGDVLGKLTLLKKLPGYPPYWQVRCTCGKEWNVRQSHLNSTTPTRACLRCANTKHGHARRQTTGQQTQMYRIWTSLKTRCYNKNHPFYKNYGARGIRVCSRWRNSFEAFLEDMGEPPTPKHTLDRKNNNDNYTPNNCRWATRREQALNSRHTR